jgi:hypothetical protein
MNKNRVPLDLDIEIDSIERMVIEDVELLIIDKDLIILVKQESIA